MSLSISVYSNRNAVLQYRQAGVETGLQGVTVIKSLSDKT